MKQLIPRSWMIIFVIFFISVIGLILGFVSGSPKGQTDCTSGSVAINDDQLIVRVADTPALRTQGLSDTPNLPKKEGMLFFFDEPGFHEFWMKDMAYPLDIIWVGEDWRIKGVTHNALPSSYPHTFTSPGPIQYVLETNVGALTAQTLATGTPVKFSGCPHVIE